MLHDNGPKKFDVVMSGGGSGGSVSPLLAVAKQLHTQRPNVRFLFLGRKFGPERVLLAQADYSFQSIPFGKFRRYFSFQNATDIIRIIHGFFASLWILWRSKPKVIMTAGSHVAVPVAWAGWVLGVPIFIHQQDITVGLANRLMAPIAYQITTTFKDEGKVFSSRKTVHTGNPVRPDLISGKKERCFQHFHLSINKPLIVCIGGGTGAQDLNEILYAALPELLNIGNVIHSTGVGKGRMVEATGYIQVPFLAAEYPDVLVAADLVITRAGQSTLTELALLGKQVIVCPLPQTHQEANAEYFARRGAVRVIAQSPTASHDLVAAVKDFIHNHEMGKVYESKIRELAVPDAAAHIAQLVMKVLEKH